MKIMINTNRIVALGCCATPGDGRNQERSQICGTYTRSLIPRMMLKRVTMIGNLWCQTSATRIDMCDTEAAPPTNATPGDGRNQELSQICGTYTSSSITSMMPRRVSMIGDRCCQRAVTLIGACGTELRHQYL